MIVRREFLFRFSSWKITQEKKIEQKVERAEIDEFCSVAAKKDECYSTQIFLDFFG